MEEKNLLKEQLNEYLGDYSDLDMLVEFVQKELDRAREEVITEIYNFVEGESGRSGRKEILKFVESLTNQKKEDDQKIYTKSIRFF